MGERLALSERDDSALWDETTALSRSAMSVHLRKPHTQVLGREEGLILNCSMFIVENKLLFIQILWLM